MCVRIDILDILPNDEWVASHYADTYMLEYTLLVEPLLREVKAERKLAALDIGVVEDKEFWRVTRYLHPIVFWVDVDIVLAVCAVAISDHTVHKVTAGSYPTASDTSRTALLLRLVPFGTTFESLKGLTSLERSDGPS